MAKQIYNYELFTNKKEELQKIREKRARRRRMQIFLLVIAAFFAVIVLYILLNSKCEYYTYKNETETEDSGDVTYVPFASGYLKYSSNGIEYQKKFGKSEWNTAVSYTHPFLVKSDTYAILGDKGENTFLLFNENGKVKELTLKYPLVQASVSNNGIIEVTMEGTDTNYIQVYGKDGKMIADMRSSVDELGYPVSAAISPEGTQLVISCYSLDGMEARTRVMFYDLSRQIQSDDLTIKGEESYKNMLIPKISFMDDDTVAVFGSSSMYIYNVKDEVKKIKKVEFEQEIQSVFENDKYVGFLLDNTTSDSEGKYELCLYDKKGNRKLSKKLDFNYETIEMWDREIIAVQNNECTILNMKGNILFQGKLEGNAIQTIMPSGGFRTYHVIFSDKTVEMKLSFFKTGD